MNCNSYNLFFETFSNKTRTKIIEILISGKKSVTEMCRLTGEEQSKISHNLKRLVDCHFLDVQREGRRRIYSLNKDTIVPILKMVERHTHKYCKGKCTKQ